MAASIPAYFAPEKPVRGTAQPAIAPDAAARRHDRGDFESYIRLTRLSDLSAAARVNGNPLDGAQDVPPAPDENL